MSKNAQTPPHQLYVLDENGFIMRDNKIMGRVSGYGPGTAWYQIAARPFDEPSVTGLASVAVAFETAVKVLEQRRLKESV